MVQLAQNRNILTKGIDLTKNVIKAIYMAIILYIITLFNLPKPSNEFNKQELQYLGDKYVPKFNKKKNDEGDKPKVIRGLAGKADCNT